MIDEELRDLGVPLPGSDPERRKRIKERINVLKAYMLYFSLHEKMPVKASTGNAVIQSSEAIS